MRMLKIGVTTGLTQTTLTTRTRHGASLQTATIMNHNWEYITSQGRGCNISNLNQKILSGIPLILPPIQLQNEFASKVEAIEEQKKLIESSIADFETLLASRMDYWFND